MVRKDIFMLISSIFVILCASFVLLFLEFDSVIEGIWKDNHILGYLLSLCIFPVVIIPIIIFKKIIYASDVRNKLKLTHDERKKFITGIVIYAFVVLFVTGNTPISYVLNYSSNNNLTGYTIRAIYYGVNAGFISWYYSKIIKSRNDK